VLGLVSRSGDLIIRSVVPNDPKDLAMKRLIVFFALAMSLLSYLSAPPASASVSAYIQVSAGAFHTCALTPTQLAFCWGQGASGQLGNGSTLNSAVPVAVAGGLVWRSISTGAAHTCGITTTGAALCWGDNTSGQLGDGTATSSTTPVTVIDPGPWRSISAGGFGASSHTCGIKTTGTLWCWGANANGQLGANTTTPSLIPVQEVTVGSWIAVSAGSAHTCAIRSTTSLFCWGANGTGQLGTGGITPWLFPKPVLAPSGWKVISAGGISSSLAHSCGLRVGVAYCWGAGSSGQLGIGATPAVLPAPGPPVLGGGTWRTISAGGRHTCGVRSTSLSYCWGGGSNGEIGNGSTAPIAPVPQPVVIIGATRTLDAGGFHTAAVLPTTAVWSWGLNNAFQLAATTPPFSPVPL
jgi:alpha-tubulin suppressor-like RCC1 family protein